MAKRKRRYHRRRTHHRRRRRHGGGRAGLLPSRDELTLMAGAAAIGFLESKAKADANFPLNKIPRPIKQLGYTGGTALALQVGAHFTGNKWLKLLAKSAWMVTAYQVGALGKPPDAADKPFTLSGIDDEHLLEGVMGALAAEGEQMEGPGADGNDIVAGLPYDDRVELPMT